MDLSSSEFEKLVGNALEHLWDFAYLGKHPLADLECVKRRMPQKARCSHVDTGRVLSAILQSAIENLKLTQHEGFSREKHYHAILHKAYVEGIENKAIADSLNISERTLYRYSAKAIQVVTQILRDWE